MNDPQRTKRFSKTEWSWILYDWANSAYSIIIMAAVLPIYFGAVTRGAGVSPENSTAYWGYASSIASLLVAVLSPILGTISDYKGVKDTFFRVFFVLGVVSTLLLSLTNNWQIMLLIYAVTCVGFNGSLVFYDAYLPDITTKERMDKVSSWGFGMGYIGGSTIPFLVAIALIQFGDKFGISTDIATRLSFVITAVWWLLFSIPMLKNVRQSSGLQREPGALGKSLRRLLATVKEARQHKHMFLFLIAYFFYIDGVGTIIKMAAKYGDSLNLGTTAIIVALLVTQIVACPCAILFGKLSEKVGTRTMILSGIVIYLGVCVVGFVMTQAWQFFLLAVLVGTSQGGIQALSRSFFGKLIPDKNKSGEYFGMYNIFSKFEAVLGTTLMGLVTQLTGKANYGVLSVAVTFVIGAVLLLFVKVPKEGELVQ